MKSRKTRTAPGSSPVMCMIMASCQKLNVHCFVHRSNLRCTWIQHLRMLQVKRKLAVLQDTTSSSAHRRLGNVLQS